MKRILFFVVILFGSLNASSQSYLKTKVSGFAKFDSVENIEWSNVKGLVTLYKDSVTFCPSHSACLVFKVYGKTKSEETKYKGKKYMIFSQQGTDSRGNAVVVKKYIAKNHDKYYDLLWIHSEQKDDILIECSTLMKKMRW